MKKKNYKTLSIRMEETELEKLRQIAEEDGRYVSQMAAWFLRSCIRDYEKNRENGEKDV